MAVIGLNLPTDIRWERICVTEDMMAEHACSGNAPPKWNPSIAVYRYVPETDYQVYPGHIIIYYKVVCTITSYQPQADEIETQIDWRHTHFQDKIDFDAKLKSYLPCNGAMIQVIVTPPADAGFVPFANYPYFMEVQPKQRILYETATDTNERASRSLENVTVGKSAGTADSLEVLDVSMGGGVNVQGGAGGTSAGVGGSRSGQEGTKMVGQNNVTDVRTTDSSREARETVSHTTQISQMYNLFQAYHLGTNRMLFYIAPRPHTLENPSGFIKPREIDGMQELFLIVNQPQDQGDPCLSVRVDTAHITSIPQSDYDQHAGPPLFINQPVPAPAKDSPDKGPRLDVESGDWYDCYNLTVKAQPQVYTADQGYHIVGPTVRGEDRSVNGQCDADIDGHRPDQDGRTLTLVGYASGHACFRNGAGDAQNIFELGAGESFLSVITGPAGQDAANLPKMKNVTSGLMQRTITFDVRSDLPVVQKAPIQVLAVTSRGLCCCATPMVSSGKVIHIEQFDDSSTVVSPAAAAPRQTQPMTIREANAVSERVTQTLKRVSSLVADPQNAPALDGEFMLAHFGAVSNASSIRQDRMSKNVAANGVVSSYQAVQLAALVGKPVNSLTYHDVASLPLQVLSSVTGKSGADLSALRLNLLGFATVQSPTVDNPPKG